MVRMGCNNTVPGTATLYSTTTPVELTSFKAKSNECSVDITWKSQTEIGFKQYELEVSDDGKSFGPLSTEAAKGNNSDYIFRHNTAEGTHYYRFKMVDWNGSFAYSPIIWSLSGNLSQTASIFVANSRQPNISAKSCGNAWSLPSSQRNKPSF